MGNNLSAYARQPARGPCWGDMGLAGSKILGLCCPILRLCWSSLGLCSTLALYWPVLGPRLADLEAYVDPCWAKRSEKWDQQKNIVKRRIFWFWWSAAYLGAMLAYLEGNVGPSWGYVGLSWRQRRPIFGLCWPILGLRCLILGLCWPILGLSWLILGAMLPHLEAYVGPCWPILSHKSRKSVKNGKSTKHRKTRGFLAGPRGRRQGRRPLSPTESRELPYGNATARGALARIGYRPLPPTPKLRGLARLRMVRDHRRVCGQRFSVKDGKVIPPSMYSHSCPKRGAQVWSKLESGRIQVKHKNTKGKTCSRDRWVAKQWKQNARRLHTEPRDIAFERK